jgi:hypothetical protein
MKKILIGLAALLVVGGGIATYLVVDHNHDVAQAKAHAKAVKAAREARIDREYKKNLALWRDDENAWQTKDDDYTACDTATSDAFGAADEVSGVISSGGSRDEFLEPTQDLSTAISRATREASSDISCLSVLLDLSKAHDKYADALNMWLEWIDGDAYQYADSPSDLPMDKHFTKGNDYVYDAQRALDEMKPGDEPVKPARGESYESPSDLTDLGDDDGSLDS